MRINVVSFDTKLTGGTRVLMECVNALAERGHSVNLITFGTPANHAWINLSANIYYANRTPLQRLAGFVYRKMFGFQPFPEEETRRVIAAMPEADISLASMSYSGYAVSRANKGIPCHFYMHYEPYVREPSYKREIIQESYFLPTRKIVNSTWLARTMKKETGHIAEGLVFPAIDHGIFYPQPKKTKNKAFTLVGLAKDKPWKGLADALRAVDIVREKGYSVEYLTFGNRFSVDSLPEDVRDIPFTFVGPKMNETLADFYRDADALLSPSYFESFPLPPLEAMAVGTPVITTPYGTEDYAEHEKNALVVPPKSPEQMAAAIIRLIDDWALYQKLAQAGPSTAKRFTWEAAGEQLEQIFQKAISEAS